MHQLIIHCLKTFYLIEVVTMRLLPLGADMNASVYRVESSERKTYFVKVKQGQLSDASLAILELLQSAGIKEIIFPIKTMCGTLTQKCNDLTLIVYPFVEGQDGFNRLLTDQQWIQLGAVLRKIHDIQVPQSMQNRMRREDFSSQWRNAVRSLYSQIDSLQIHDKVGIKSKTFLQEKQTAIAQMVSWVEQLAHKLHNQPPQFVLCHSDIHAGNILICDADTFYIVDWDDPIMAPQEKDLMFIGGGVGGVWNQTYQKELFYTGYGNVIINQTALAYYRLERILEDIALYGQELLMGQEQNQDREQIYKYLVDMFAPRDVVSIAVETYNGR